MITLCDLLVVALILAAAYWGWLVGLQQASVAALEVLACLSGAILLHEPVAGFLHGVFTAVLGDWLSQAWSIAIAFSILAWGSLTGLRLWLHRTAKDDADDGTEADPLGDRLAGGVAGGVGGALLAGGILITVSMLPILAGLKPSGDRMLLDVGKTVLRATGHFLPGQDQPRVLPVWGEPPSKMSVLSSRLTSEPWFDTDDDAAFGDADRFRDVDGNGVFTKDLYFVDLDGDGIRWVGLVDKYVAGRWDGGLISNDRPRPEPKTPPVTSPQQPADSPKKKPSEPAPAAPSEPKRPEPPRPDATRPDTPPTESPKPEKPVSEKKPEDDF